MPQIIPCPACGASLRVRDEYAGKGVKCPKCTHLITIPPLPAPAPAATEETAVRPAAPPPLPEEVGVTPVDEEEQATEVRPLAQPRGQRCPSCGARNPPEARKCRDCKEWLDEEEDEPEVRPRRRKKASYKPCPRCGARGAERVAWTPWGSFYGPALFTHVRCPECRYAYNGRTGGSNLVPAIIFVTIPAVLIAGIVVFLYWLFRSRMGG
jgi:predicted Zn finger-like uncharacterized protein